MPPDWKGQFQPGGLEGDIGLDKYIDMTQQSFARLVDLVLALND